MLLLLLRDLKLTSFVRLDQGNLTVTLVSASGLKAADRGGTSDPYCVFRINKEKVYKSQTYKKQLAPVFKNESFTAPVVARNKAEFDVKIYDWDQIGANTLLAEGPIPIADLESFAMREVDVPLRGGSIKLRLKWEPQLLARKREGTSLLGSTTRILTGGTGLAGDVVGYGVGAGGKVLTGGTRMVGGCWWCYWRRHWCYWRRHWCNRPWFWQDWRARQEAFCRDPCSSSQRYRRTL
mgnify:CR=1 FL=1